MNRIAVAVAATAFLSLSATDTKAEFVSGNQLYDWCTTSERDAIYFQNDASCREYIIGVSDGMTTAADVVTAVAKLDTPFELICVPDRVRAGQLREVVVRYLRDHPADRHESAAFQVALAIKDAYPCTR